MSTSTAPQPPPSTLHDLLVILGASRFGTDWPNVAAAVRVAQQPLEVKDPGCEEPPSAAECEERYRALVEGVPAELSYTASQLQSVRLDALLAAREKLCDRIKELCLQLPPNHPARPAAAFQDPPAAPEVDEAEEAAPSSGSKRARPTTDAALEAELDDNWANIAEVEEANVRRASVPGVLNKMLQLIGKHRWAYPFKRPVTDKEAPDYKDIITNPMDFATLKKRIETGAVADVPQLVHDLELVCDNCMTYNGKGTDYYRMAQTLKEIVRVHRHLEHHTVR